MRPQDNPCRRWSPVTERVEGRNNNARLCADCGQPGTSHKARAYLQGLGLSKADADKVADAGLALLAKEADR